MFKSFSVKNFRCFEDVEISNLGRVNLISGKNNVGKTSLLEAIYLLCYSQPGAVAIIHKLRGLDSFVIDLPQGPSSFDYLFRDFSSVIKIEIIGEHSNLGRQSFFMIAQDAPLGFILNDEKSRSNSNTDVISSSIFGKSLEFDISGKKYKVTVSDKGVHIDPQPQPPSFPTLFINPQLLSSSDYLAEQYSKIAEIKKQGPLIKELNVIEPRLQSIEVNFRKNSPVLHADIGLSRTIPVNLMGDGMLRLAGILMHIHYAKNGVILVDEVENGLHHSVMKQIWAAIGRAAAENNVQVFATTHSYECYIAAHQAFQESGNYDFRFHRLENVKGKIKCFTLDEETLSTAIEQNWEVR